MPPNPFDKASRFTAKLDPPAFFAWATGLPAERLAFREWLDTRAAALPTTPDRTGDTVARVEAPTGTAAPWAVAVEFQIEPDPLMFGRLMVYLGHLWQSIKPDVESGSRFEVAAVVVNLTGVGTASRNMDWPEAGFGTQLKVRERNLATENADELVTGIEGGRWSRALLPWLPLMIGGNDPGIIERWKSLADGEPDFRRKANYATLATTFASAARRETIWKKALEGWNVIESTIVNEWKAEESVVSVLAVLEAKFGTLPNEVEAKIRQTHDLKTLREWLPQAAKAATLDEFRRACSL